MSFDFWQANFAPEKSAIVTRFIEFWCQHNCKHGWRIEEYRRSLFIWFEHPRDYVLFKISEEYSYF